jgi:hypothetical protein
MRTSIVFDYEVSRKRSITKLLTELTIGLFVCKESSVPRIPALHRVLVHVASFASFIPRVITVRFKLQTGMHGRFPSLNARGIFSDLDDSQKTIRHSESLSRTSIRFFDSASDARCIYIIGLRFSTEGSTSLQS